MEGADFLTNAIEWARQGRRSIKIEIGTPFHDGDEPTVSIWAYDFDVLAGEFVPFGGKFPKTGTLRCLRKTKLLEELASLQTTTISKEEVRC